jgi:cell division protein FtsB
MSGSSRKSRQESWFWPVAVVALLCLGFGALGLGYVWQKNQVDRLGREIRLREQRLAELRLQNERLRRQLATLYTPRFLEQRVRELNLGLVPAHPSQVWRLPEPQGWPEPRTVAGRTEAGRADPG